MSVERDDEAHLRAELVLVELPDDGFAAAVMARVVRHRRRRVRWLTVASTLAAALAALGIVASPAGGPAPVDMTSTGTVAVLALEAMCGLVWIGTASRGTSAAARLEEGE